jgi:sterol desaturase/sphingolipid hydroxylase (fatty acid hydroxylase superfamily)
MFESDLLDRLTRVHHAVPLLVYTPVIAIELSTALTRLEPSAVLGLAGAGWVLWTLVEYWVHRALFHFEPERGLGARLHWMVHGVHHDHPNDPLRLVMPPVVSVPLAAGFLVLFVLLLGLEHAVPLHAGFTLGYLAYDVIHYRLHHHIPRSRLGRRLRAVHMRHHFEDDTRGFGITVSWWDRVFGTVAESRGAGARSP